MQFMKFFSTTNYPIIKNERLTTSRSLHVNVDLAYVSERTKHYEANRQCVTKSVAFLCSTETLETVSVRHRRVGTRVQAGP